MIREKREGRRGVLKEDLLNSSKYTNHQFIISNKTLGLLKSLLKIMARLVVEKDEKRKRSRRW
jgi:hypothetical protein